MTTAGYHATVLLKRSQTGRARRGQSICDTLLRGIRETVSDPHAQIHRHDSGQPYITGSASDLWTISSSTAEGAAAVGLAASLPIGIDLETLDLRDSERSTDYQKLSPSALMNQAAAPDERSRCDACRYPDDHAFTRIWSRKEAVLKALGTGLATDPRRVRVNCCGPATLDGQPVALLSTTAIDLDKIGTDEVTELGDGPTPSEQRRWLSVALLTSLSADTSARRGCASLQIDLRVLHAPG